MPDKVILGFCLPPAAGGAPGRPPGILRPRFSASEGPLPAPTLGDEAKLGGLGRLPGTPGGIRKLAGRPPGIWGPVGDGPGVVAPGVVGGLRAAAGAPCLFMWKAFILAMISGLTAPPRPRVLTVGAGRLAALTLPRGVDDCVMLVAEEGGGEETE